MKKIRIKWNAEDYFALGCLAFIVMLFVGCLFVIYALGFWLLGN